MSKIKILVTGLMFMLVSCTYYIKYNSNIGLDAPISAKTSIKVNLSEVPPRIAPTSIVKAITDDLSKNVFINLVKTNPELLVVVDVRELQFNNEPWGLLWLPLIYLGAPSNKCKATTDIGLRILKPDATLVKSYSATSYRKKWRGLYYNHNAYAVIEEAIKEAIVAAVEGKRKPYEESQEITKPTTITKPPRLIFDYSLFDQNNDKILDGGERVSLKVTVKNQGEGTAQGVKVLLSGESKVLDYLGREKSIGDIPAGGEKEAIFEAVLPYKIEPDNASLFIRVTEARGFDALKESELLIAMQPAKVEREREVISVLVDVDQPLKPTSFKREDAYAVIIGISDYRSNKIPKVKYARRDAETMKEYLVNVCGIPKENIILLIDDKATGTDLIAYIEE